MVGFVTRSPYFIRWKCRSSSILDHRRDVRTRGEAQKLHLPVIMEEACLEVLWKVSFPFGKQSSNSKPDSQKQSESMICFKHYYQNSNRYMENSGQIYQHNVRQSFKVRVVRKPTETQSDTNKTKKQTKKGIRIWCSLD